jgi:hypothetical protein
MTHIVTYAPADGGGYLVTCSDGCRLGTSARQPDEEGAQRRVELHRMATGTPEHVDCPNYETGFDQGAACDLTATTMYPQPGNCFQRGWNAGRFAQHRLHYTGKRILTRVEQEALRLQLTDWAESRETRLLFPGEDSPLHDLLRTLGN